MTVTVTVTVGGDRGEEGDGVDGEGGSVGKEEGRGRGKGKGSRSEGIHVDGDGRECRYRDRDPRDKRSRRRSEDGNLADKASEDLAGELQAEERRKARTETDGAAAREKEIAGRMQDGFGEEVRGKEKEKVKVDEGTRW